jgi:peroxidase
MGEFFFSLFIFVTLLSNDDFIQSKWKKDGRTLTKSIKYNISPAGSLFISNVNDLDAGRYECTVTNEYGRVTASCVVSVR